MNKIQLIAETAWHHEGDFIFMMNLVEQIIKHTKADIIKLHISLDIEEYMLRDHSLYDKLHKWSLPKKNWEEIIKLIKTSDKKLMVLVNDIAAIEFGMGFEPDIVELHSMCLNDIKLINALNQKINKNTIVVLGVGGTPLEEIDGSINSLATDNIVLMFGFQNYPTKYENINFCKMRKIMQLYNGYDFGYADHTAWNEPDNILITLFGAALGMKYIEKHVTTHFGKERVDWEAAISFQMFNELKKKLQLLEKCTGDGKLMLNKGEREYSVFGPMKKAAILSEDISKGEPLILDKIDFKRTRQVSDMSQLEVVHNIGKKMKQDVKKGKCLMRRHIE